MESVTVQPALPSTLTPAREVKTDAVNCSLSLSQFGALIQFQPLIPLP